VIDFIDMVLESNRDLVLRRLVECLGRDRTRHQVAEVTSLGLVQMTRKRIGSGLIETFSEDCDHCKGRGIIVHEQPIEPSNRSVGMGGGMGGGQGNSQGGGNDEPRGRRSRGGRGRNRTGEDVPAAVEVKPSPMALAGTKPHPEDAVPVLVDEVTDVVEVAEASEVVQVTEVAEAVVPKGADSSDSADEQAGETVPEAPEPVSAAPIVVTTTRRRRAGRPAGPAVAVEADAAVETAASPVPENADGADSSEGPGNAELEDGEGAAPVFHVPVKKRGARKR
jgi:ribonuclease E